MCKYYIPEINTKKTEVLNRFETTPRKFLKVQAYKPDSVPTQRLAPVIYLVLVSPPKSIDLPILHRYEQHRSAFKQKQDLFDLSTHEVCHAPEITFAAGGLLPHLFTLTPLAVTSGGGIFSVALSVSRLREILPVRKHGALCCPDFPPSFSEARQGSLYTPKLAILKPALVFYSFCFWMGTEMPFWGG
jgi:hypothetical protein